MKQKELVDTEDYDNEDDDNDDDASSVMARVARTKHSHRQNITKKKQKLRKSIYKLSVTMTS